jgi:hypothetical protein
MNKKNPPLHLRVHREEDKSSSSHQQILARTKDKQSSNWWQQHLAFSDLSFVAPLSTIFPMSFLHAVIVTTHTPTDSFFEIQLQ